MGVVSATICGLKRLFLYFSIRILAMDPHIADCRISKDQQVIIQDLLQHSVSTVFSCFPLSELGYRFCSMM